MEGVETEEKEVPRLQKKGIRVQVVMGMNWMKQISS
jgi:hypothetical protein